MDEILSVDEKGRVHLPKRIRERLGIMRTVKAIIKGHKLILESAEDPLEELAEITTTRFTDFEEEWPSMKSAAEKQLLRESE